VPVSVGVFGTVRKEKDAGKGFAREKMSRQCVSRCLIEFTKNVQIKRIGDKNKKRCFTYAVFYVLLALQRRLLPLPQREGVD
jgi:hypothetical protein